MLESLVITLREGVEAALVVGIILAYLRRTGREVLTSWVYSGLGLAILASLAFAAVFQIVGLDPENEYLEGALMIVGGLFVASMVAWVWSTARQMRGRMEARLSTLLSSRQARAQGLGLFLFTFLMVFREGGETVLFLYAITLGEFQILQLLGAAAGLGLAFLFAYLFIRGSLRINLGRFFAVTGIVLFFLAAKLLLSGIHEFAEVGLLPLSAGAMRVIGYFVRDKSSSVMMMVLIALPVLVVLWDLLRRVPAVAQAAAAETAAERRKVAAAARQERLWRLSLAVVAVTVIFAMASTALAAPAYSLPQAQEVQAAQGQVRIDTASLEVGKLHKYHHATNEGEARFLVARLENGQVVTSLDACQICGAKGYGQDGPHAICTNCLAPIYMPTLGQGGGCNPLPLAARMEGSTLVIESRDLAAAADKFK